MLFPVCLLPLKAEVLFCVLHWYIPRILNTVWHIEVTQYLFFELISVFLFIVLVFISLAQPSLLPYKPSGSTKMYYVPQLSQIPSFPDSKSDTTVESSHSGIAQIIQNFIFWKFCLYIGWLILEWHRKAQCSLIFHWNMELFIPQALIQIGELFGHIYLMYTLNRYLMKKIVWTVVWVTGLYLEQRFPGFLCLQCP